MLVPGRADKRSEARCCNQPAEAVAALGTLDHVPESHLEDVKDAVEVGGEHAPPVILGPVDEGVPTAAADAGIGEAAVDPTKSIEGRHERMLNRRAIGDVADLRLNSWPKSRELGQRVAILLRI